MFISHPYFKLLVIFLFLSKNSLVFSQTPANSNPLFSVDERIFIESKWKYTYTLQSESRTIVHQAEDRYDYFLYFKYDYTYEQFLNGKKSKGTWSIQGKTLFYAFKQIPKFRIADLSNSRLVLEFQQPNSKATYEYHFIAVDEKDAPFIREANELPMVKVDAKKKKSSKSFWPWNKEKEESLVEQNTKEQTYLSIELVGGGFYGGLDPTLRDYIQIKSTGRLIKEYKSVNQGTIVTKKDVSRVELEQLIEYAMAQKFFDMNRIYDCEESQCEKRKSMKPTPIPLRLSIAYGDRKKVITITIWGKDKYGTGNYVQYPPALDEIIDAIQRMAHRGERKNS
jgi:hypothetical protein